ncbi:PREDICTED: uncharacterized protein LOC107348312 [Acropora digitifera]|uniref:uncharacterized protein LOC107348312 n=1 Tax=Acropora digitifera TaxID=70779 RepID=UPI00077ADDC7|nr:PREDICTED: uncharacterized protein LOC107348312 [Acropora digitifera]
MSFVQETVMSAHDLSPHGEAVNDVSVQAFPGNSVFGTATNELHTIQARNKTKPPSWLSVKQEARRRIRFTSVCTDRILASKRSKTRLKMPRKKKQKWREVKPTSPRIPAKTAS